MGGMLAQAQASDNQNTETFETTQLRDMRYRAFRNRLVVRAVRLSEMSFKKVFLIIH